MARRVVFLDHGRGAGDFASSSLSGRLSFVSQRPRNWK